MPRKTKISDKDIVSIFIAKSQSAPSVAEAVRETVVEADITKRRLLSVIQQYRAQDAAKEIAREIKEETYRSKIPIIKNIIGLSLETILEFVSELRDDPVRKACLSIGEVKSLAELASDLNGLVRLEEGKSTMNLGIHAAVEHNHTVTLQALQKLKELDPIMDYPEISSVTPAIEHVEPK